MLPKERRLTAGYDFKKIRRRGKKVNTAFFALYFLRGQSSLPSRFGVVVSTKIDKRAAKRNRVRRIFSEELRSFLPRIKNGFDFVFWVRAQALEVGPKRLRDAIRNSLMKVQVLDEGGL